MKLTAAARLEGISLSVSSIFKRPRLCDLATYDQAAVVEPQKEYSPFSLISNSDILGLLKGMSIQRPDIQDILPTTNFQNYSVNQTYRKPRSKLLYLISSLGRNIDTEHLLSACRGLVRRRDSLRTIFLLYNENFFQVVLRELPLNIPVHTTHDDPVAYARGLCKKDAEGDISLGQPWVGFWIIKQDQNCVKVVMRISHAQYDGISLPLLLNDLEDLYLQKSESISPSFSSFTAGILNATDERCKSYWCHLLDGSVVTDMPPLDEAKTQLLSADELEATVKHVRTISLPRVPPGITLATLISATWALVIS